MPTDSILADTATNLSNRQLRRLLNAIGACDRGQAWLGDRDLTTAWAECPNGAHLLWVCARIGVDRRLIVRAAAACAETALQDVPKGEDRPRLAIEAARAWADAPSEEHRLRALAAAHAASDAAFAAYATAYAAYAAHATSAAAYATAYTTQGAAAASYAAYSASNAARAAQTDALRRCAALVRKHIPFEAVLAAARQTLERRP